jgi:chromosome segregation ATPase
MNRAARDYEKLKAFADQLRKENKKLQAQIEKILFERNANEAANEAAKRSYETQIRDLKAAHGREIAAMNSSFQSTRERRTLLEVDHDRLIMRIADLEIELGRRIPPAIKQWDGIRKLYIDD